MHFWRQLTPCPSSRSNCERSGKPALTYEHLLHSLRLSEKPLFLWHLSMNVASVGWSSSRLDKLV